VSPFFRLNDDTQSDTGVCFDDEDDGTATPPLFPELETQINNAIQLLGGTVFPKLDWSAPKVLW